MSNKAEKVFSDIDKKLDKMEAGLEKELLREYKNSLKQLFFHVSESYRKHDNGQGLTSSEMYKLGRYESLIGEISREVGKLTGKKIEILNDGLSEIYKNGYIYSVEGIEKVIGESMGLPIVSPDVVAASVNNPISGLTLSERLEAQRVAVVASLKGVLTQGIIQAKSYREITEDIQRQMEFSAEKSKRIARTETHRVRNEARQKSYEESAARGVVIYKEWLATKDGRTRHSHGALDGAVAEVGERFKQNGASALTPGGFGIAAEDINCRCRTIPYFPEDETNPKVIPKAAPKVEKTKEKAGEKEEEQGFIPAKTIKEANKWAVDNVKAIKAANYKGFDVEIANAFNEQLKVLSDLIPEVSLDFVGDRLEGNKVTKLNYKPIKALAVYSFQRGTYTDKTEKNMLLLVQLQKDKEELRKAVRGEITRGFLNSNVAEGDEIKHIISHEFAHALDDHLSQGQFGLKFSLDLIPKIKAKYNKEYASKELGYSYSENGPAMEKMRFWKDSSKKLVSDYASTKECEFFAEAFSEYLVAKEPRTIARLIGEEVEAVLGRKLRK